MGRFPEGSIAQQLAAAKSVFVEPMRATADEFDAVLSRYKGAASAGSGAVLFGVLRGRASEGLNFSHDHARGVVMIGIAYPPIYDIKVQSKLNRSEATGGGREWCVLSNWQYSYHFHTHLDNTSVTTTYSKEYICQNCIQLVMLV